MPSLGTYVSGDRLAVHLKRHSYGREEACQVWSGWQTEVLLAEKTMLSTWAKGPIMNSKMRGKIDQTVKTQY